MLSKKKERERERDGEKKIKAGSLYEQDLN